MSTHKAKAVTKPVERVLLDRAQLQSLELDIFLRRHIERYAMVRQHLYGTVLDCACGVGYGAFLVSKNPDVRLVIGVDSDPDAIVRAQREFAYEKTQFACADLTRFETKESIDVLLSIETIEHLADPTALPALAQRLDIPHVIVTFPSKKTTHYNPYHLHDFRTQDLIDLFDEYVLYRRTELNGEVEMLYFALHPRWVAGRRTNSEAQRARQLEERIRGVSGVGGPLRMPPRL